LLKGFDDVGIGGVIFAPFAELDEAGAHEGRPWSITREVPKQRIGSQLLEAQSSKQ
jgi:hypothetical protein